ncbi:MAG: PVC-type heme-binding CxxCH protein [Pirellula sp.]
MDSLKADWLAIPMLPTTGRGRVFPRLTLAFATWLGCTFALLGQESPVSPKESLKWLHMQPGYRVELVASEPQVVDPVSMQIDELGRIWAVEMRDYPVEDETPKSRIVILQDKDHDGFFESSHIFADKLRFATGVQPWKDGALVTVHGQLLMLRDTDGDLVADVREVWLDGFFTGNPQLRANHPMVGPDGWLYVASGLRGGKVKSLAPMGDPVQEALDLTGSDLRVNLRTGQMEAIAGPSQFGLSFDRLGHRYGVSNRQPCFEILSERAELGLSPLAGLANALNEVSPGEAASRVFPLVNAWTTSNLHAGQFTAACGMLVTHSRHFPEAPFATALTCEPTGGLVQRRSVARDKGRSVVTDDHKGPEWLASSDPWFRPVDLYEGPGGDIYVVDMYRAVIEHPDWVPAELKKRPDERFGDSHGRIYRVTRDSSPRGKAGVVVREGRPKIADWLIHADAWNRNVATRLLAEETQLDGNSDWFAKIRELIASGQESSSTNANSTYANLYLFLASGDGLDEDTVTALLRSKDSDQRAMAWAGLRRSNRKWSGRWSGEAIHTLRNPAAAMDEMRAAAWYIASQVGTERVGDEFVEACAAVLVKNTGDAHLWMALSAACINQMDPLLSAILRNSDATNNTLTGLGKDALTRLASRLAGQASSERLNELANHWVTSQKTTQNIFTRHCSYSVLEGLVKSGKLSVVGRSDLEGLVIEGLESDDVMVQKTCVTMLGYCSTDRAKQYALQLLDRPDSRLAKLAISACSSHDTPEFRDWLFKRFPSALPDIRQDLFAAIRSKPERLAALVDRLESGSMSMKIFDAAQIQNLKSVKDPSIAPRLAKLLASALDSNRQRVIDQYSKQLATIQVDSKNHRGKSIFEKNCSACHRLDSVGTQVGPDISDSRVHTFENLLVSVLDPNRTIDANYFRFIARTEDGRIVEGVLRDSNAQTVTLQNQNGAHTLQRSEIEELKSSATSLMPEGIESQIPATDMAELLWYIKNWRYSADGIPVNASITK